VDLVYLIPPNVDSTNMPYEYIKNQYTSSLLMGLLWPMFWTTACAHEPDSWGQVHSACTSGAQIWHQIPLVCDFPSVITQICIFFYKKRFMGKECIEREFIWKREVWKWRAGNQIEKMGFMRKDWELYVWAVKTIIKWGL
jgi:hypothetical protein